jgi:FkbM family methyltransferase
MFATEDHLLDALPQPPIWARLARLRAFLWRFHTLPFAERLFATVSSPCVFARPFAGHTLRVDVSRTNTHRLLYLEGERFVAERFLLRQLLRRGMRVVDVGANIGYFLLLFEQSIGPEGSIVCLEPEPDNAVELERNIRNNSFTNVELLRLAAGDEDGLVSLTPGINGVVKPDGSGSITVQIRRLDSLLQGRVDFIKIDVEGFEHQVLRGAERVLRDRQPTLVVEVHPGLIPNPAGVAEIFSLLTSVYPTVEAYRTAALRHYWTYVTTRYWQLGTLEKLADLDALAKACASRRQSDPFWVVARRRQGASSRA